MLNFAIVWALVGCALASVGPGGLVPAKQEDVNPYPWQVSIHRSGFQFCSGVLYSGRHVLTVAHCLEDIPANSLKVRLGTDRWKSGGELYSIRSSKIHEQFNAVTMENDIGLIYPVYYIVEGPTMQSIPISLYVPSSGTGALVAGWGTTYFGFAPSFDTLQQNAVRVISQSDCASSNYGYGNEVKSSMICGSADLKVACQVDSGSPMVYNNQLIGLVSWGYGCSLAKYPVVYTDAVQFSSWIVR